MYLAIFGHISHVPEQLRGTDALSVLLWRLATDPGYMQMSSAWASDFGLDMRYPNCRYCKQQKKNKEKISRKSCGKVEKQKEGETTG